MLQKLAVYPRRLADLADGYFSTVMFDETYSQRDGTLIRRSSSDAGFPVSQEDWVLSGPHFFVANPFYKTPRKNCNTPLAYDSINLETLPDDYLPRTNYRPMADHAEYLRRTPRVSWLEEGKTQGRAVTDYYRHAHRRALSNSGERTAIGILIPPAISHIDGCFSITFRDVKNLICFSTALSSVPVDFLIKSTGKGDLRGDLADKLPLLEKQSAFLARFMCLTKFPISSVM